MRREAFGTAFNRTPQPRYEPGITEFRRKWYASADGEHGTEVPAELGQNIALTLRMQEKIDDALQKGNRPGFLRTVHMLNCRKTIDAVRGAGSVRDMIRTDAFKGETVTREDIERASGIPELRSDVEHMLAEHRYPVIGTSEGMHIDTHLDEHPHDLPAIVHVFSIPEEYETMFLSKLLNDPSGMSADECIARLPRNHTFLVLGKTEDGSYLCFQKQGPNIRHSFELRDLDSLVALSVAPEEDTLYLSFIGPALSDEQRTQRSSDETYHSRDSAVVGDAGVEGDVGYHVAGGRK